MSLKSEPNEISSEHGDLKSKVLKSILWVSGVKYLGQIVSWCITVVVMRILQPGDYGLVSLTNVCINFLALAGELGLGAAIIQRKDIGQRQLSQLFGFILVSHGCVYSVLFLSSDLIALFFAEPKLAGIIRVLSSNVLLLSLFIVPQAILTRAMEFRKTSLVALSGNLAGSLTTLVLAWKGFGVWALVWSAILCNFIYVIGYCLIARVLIRPSFDFHGIGRFLSYGGCTMGVRMLHYFYTTSDILIGGRMLGPQKLGPYSVAAELSSIPMERFLPILNQVAFPAYASIQSDLSLVRKHFMKGVRLVSLLMFPAFWGLLVIAPELLGLVLGPKWSSAIVPFQVLCFIMPFRAMSSLFSPMLYGLGKPNVNLIYVLVGSILLPVCFLIGARYEFLGLALAWVFGFSIVFVTALVCSSRVISLGIREYTAAILPSILASAAMAASLLLLKSFLRFSMPLVLLVALLIASGCLFYFFTMMLLNKETLHEAFGLLPLKWNPFRSCMRSA